MGCGSDPVSNPPTDMGAETEVDGGSDPFGTLDSGGGADAPDTTTLPEVGPPDVTDTATPIADDAVGSAADGDAGTALDADTDAVPPLDSGEVDPGDAPTDSEVWSDDATDADGPVDGGGVSTGDAPPAVDADTDGPPDVDCAGEDNGVPCDDDDPCTLGESCFIGKCQGGSPKVCDGQGPCRVGTCIEGTGGCTYVDADEGADCEDDDLCSQTSTCVAGLCTGADPISCDEQGACRLGTCLPGSGCNYIDAPNGEPCDVNCFTSAACAGGICKPELLAPLSCAPSEEICVEEWLCDPTTGECTTGVPASAGLVCEADDSICTPEICDGEGGCISAGAAETCAFESQIDHCFDWACNPIEGCERVAWNPDEICAGPTCNDGWCVGGEDCFSCGPDCGECCGDGICAPDHEEDCQVCGLDCGPCCGNGSCDFGETCNDCAGDCGVCCGDGQCSPEYGESCLLCPSDCGECCGNGVCDADFGEHCFSCEADCGACCGNGTCDFTETCATCAGDCGDCCSDGFCNPELGDNCQTCPSECGTCCGNGSCDPEFGEDCSLCPDDCGECCGDGSCESSHGETCGFCPEDCGSCCGNGVCDPGETCEACSADCGPCPCGNGLCCSGETCDTCPEDCDSCPFLGTPLAECLGDAMGVEGVGRNCGWTVGGVETCSPGAPVTIACHGVGNCNLGSCAGDPMLRICPGAGVPCTNTQAVAQNDNACGTDCPYVTFLCPPDGAVTVLHAPHTYGSAYTCNQGAFPLEDIATKPCDTPTCGLDRECGWLRRAVTTCSPGLTFSIGCDGCGVGTSAGNPMVRLCAGDVTSCSAADAVAANDDSPTCGGGGAKATFTCPDAGAITVLTGDNCTSDSASTCDLCMACPDCTPPW